MNSKVLRAFVAALIVTVGGAWADETAGPPKPDAAKAPGFTLADQEGRKVSLSDYAGKIAVLEWLNWDCPFSRRHFRLPLRSKAKAWVCLSTMPAV